MATAAHIAEHEADSEGEQRGYIKGTDFSLPYTSQWSRLHHSEVDLLRHVNCGYLSTYGVPPTLLSLKQHAQGLCNLILKLIPTLRAGEVDALNSGDPTTLRSGQNSAFDWLNDLQTPYTNDDPDHHKPLNALLNEVKSRKDAYGSEYHCPLTETTPRGRGEAVRPFANHHNLIMHANACLERLDHEFSSEGGLMALLPTDDETETADRKNARNSLLGQWLAFTQHLVGRMHELEIAYGNALDMLGGKSVVPLQHLSTLGPDGRSGREIAYPQDRWLLVNAGDDVFEFVHDILDKQEVLVSEKEKVWRDKGVTGEYQWSRNGGGKAHARGIIPVNLTTRFYRIAGQGRGTIFILPAWESNPAVEHTKRLEQNPTVVSALQPKFPIRVTELEKRTDEKVARMADLESQNKRLSRDTIISHAQLASLEAELERVRAANRVLMAAVGKESQSMAVDVHVMRSELDKVKKELAREQEAKAERLQDLRSLEENLRRHREEIAQRDKLIAQLRTEPRVARTS
jgi:hypothetical protein